MPPAARAAAAGHIVTAAGRGARPGGDAAVGRECIGASVLTVWRVAHHRLFYATTITVARVTVIVLNTFVPDRYHIVTPRDGYL